MKMFSFVFAIIAFGASYNMAMPLATKQKVALVAAYPGYFMGTHSFQDPGKLEITTEKLSPIDVQEKLGNLRPISLEIRDILNQTVNKTVYQEWGLVRGIMDRIRRRIQFRWTLTETMTSDMEVHEAERLKALIRLSGYVMFIHTGLKSPSANALFQSATRTVQDIRDKITSAASQIRGLLMNFSDRDIYDRTMKCHNKPNGQIYLENGSSQILSLRYLVALALEDMQDTFSHMQVTDSDFHLDG